MASETEEYARKLVLDCSLDEALQQDEHGVYTLKVSQKLWIKFTDLNPGLNLMGEIGTLPSENRETFLMMLMQIHLFGKGTQGGVMGYDEEHQRIILTHAHPYKNTYEEFKEAVEDFLNTVEFYQNELQAYLQGEKSHFAS